MCVVKTYVHCNLKLILAKHLSKELQKACNKLVFAHNLQQTCQCQILRGLVVSKDPSLADSANRQTTVVSLVTKVQAIAIRLA